MRWRTMAAVVAATSLLGTVSCSVDKTSPPMPTGPSEFALSLSLTATPDVIRQDGASQSTIQIWARDATALPVSGLSVRLETLANGQVVDFGVLSSRTLTTGGDGRAVVTYVAPGPPPASAEADVMVTIRAVPVGSNYANAQARSVDIRLTRPGVILPPNGAPQPSFFPSPAASAENETVFFDASASRDDGQIVSYAWNFGDGSGGSGRLTSHAYELAGTYQVTLTVTDDRGISASTAPAEYRVSPSANPVASFTISPTSPAVGTSIVFNAALSTVPTGRQIVAWDWEFGDGTQAQGVAPIHTYAAAQTYTVVLTVTDNTGRKGVTSKTIAVTASPMQEPRPGATP